MGAPKDPQRARDDTGLLGQLQLDQTSATTQDEPRSGDSSRPRLWSPPMQILSFNPPDSIGGRPLRPSGGWFIATLEQPPRYCAFTVDAVEDEGPLPYSLVAEIDTTSMVGCADHETAARVAKRMGLEAWTAVFIGWR